MPIVIDSKHCCGCRSCVLACSYHHTKTFGIKKATSMDIRRRPKEGKFAIVLYKQAEDGHVPCDCAEGSELCLKYCELLVQDDKSLARDELRAILRGEEAPVQEGA